MKYTFTSPNGEEYEVEGPDGSSREQAFNVLQEGIKAGYYKPKKKSVGAIPGQEGEEARVATLKAQPGPSVGDKLLGAGEAALATATGLFSGIQAPIAGLAKSAFGMVPDAEKETARLMQEQTYAPRTEVGKDYAANVGKVINDVLAPLGPGNLTGLAQARPMPGLLRKDKPITQPPVVDRSAILKETTTPVAENVPKQEVIRVGKDGEAYVSTPETEFVRQAAQERMVSELDAAREAEMPQRTLNAVQEEIPFSSSVEEIAKHQRTKQGDLFLDAEHLDNVEQRTLKGQQEELAWRQRQEEAAQEQSAQRSRDERMLSQEEQLQRIEDQLREQAYKPTGDGQGPKTRNFNRFGQGGAIHPRMAEDLYNLGQSVMRGADGLLKLFYHGATQPIEGVFKKSKWGDLGEGVYVTDDPHTAGRFAQGVRGSNKEPQYGGNTHPVYLNLDHVFNDASFVGNKDWQAWVKSVVEPIAKRSFDYKEGAGFKKHVDSLLEKLANNQARTSDLFYENKGDYSSVNPWNTSIATELEKAGWKGIEVTDNRYHQVMVFDPVNVKDALSTPEQQARINKFGQGGSAPIIGDLAEGIVRLGRGLKAKFTGEVPPKPDTIATPRSAATIKAKQEKAAKAEAIGLKDSVYSAPTTIEEVLANPGKDLTTSLQDLTPGMYAMVRKNAANNVLKFVNRTFTEARLNKIKDSVELITGRNAYNDLLRKLTPEEKVLVAQDALTLDKEGKLWTDAKAEQLGYTPAMKVFMDWRMKAHKTVADKADAVLAEQGMKALNRRNSYAPSNYDTAYTALVGKIGVDANGKKTFKVVVPLNANSHWELKKALAWAKEKYSGAEYQIQELPRRGLNTQSTKGYKGVAKEGIARLLEEMAKLDPNMQAAKAELDSWIEGQTQKLYGHDVHLLRKQGLEGSIGDRPWFDARRNAEDFFAQEVNHIEEALQYWNYQKPINETRKLAAEPSIGPMKNTVKVMDKYLQHVTGQGLNPIGAALNTVVDAVFAAFGKGSGKTINNVTNTTREVATIWMMGVYNPTFMNVQLSQTLTGMVPEVARLRSEFGLGPETVATSFGNSTFGLTMMGAADAIGKLDSVSVAPHLVEAYKWMKEHGLTRYNEVEQSHAATQNPKWHTTKQVLSLPITIPEKITTPQAFMWAVDMMHQAGKTGDDLYLSAYNAAKYAMTEYHPDEAPMVYQRLGVVGQHIGGLKKFVHNAVDQQASRSLELAKHPAAFASMMGMTLLTMGAMGLAGVGTLDKLSVSLTDKGLRDHYDEMFGTSKTSQGVRDGFLSVLTGYDLQTRYSMADLIPNSFGEAVAGPHISKLAKMGMSLIDYGMNPSEHSFREMSKQMVPSGLAGTLEEKYLLGKQGQVLDKEGQNKFPGDMKRTQAEHTVRAFGGPRPIRERLYDEQKYQADVVQRKMDRDRGAAAKEMVVAVGFGDDKGFKAAMQKFIDSEGDISTLDQRIQTYMEDKGMSAKQRAAGTPGESPSSIGRFRRYQER